MLAFEFLLLLFSVGVSVGVWHWCRIRIFIFGVSLRYTMLKLSLVCKLGVDARCFTNVAYL